MATEQQLLHIQDQSYSKYNHCWEYCTSMELGGVTDRTQKPSASLIIENKQNTKDLLPLCHSQLLNQVT